MKESALDIALTELDGIGPKTEERLRGVGITSVLDLAASIPDEIVEVIGGSRENASALVFVAQRKLMEMGLLENDFVPAIDVLERRRSMLRCTTGSKNLDELLKGGVETQAITEFWGEFGSGKTQICHSLCVTAQLPLPKGGLGGGVVYMDTEATFRPERVWEISESRSLNPREVLGGILLCKVYNASHLELVIKSVGRQIEENNVKVLIVDSMISLHRAEFIGRGTLAERQQRLNSLIHRLLRTAEIYNIAVVVTNQVLSSPDTFFGDPTRPAGGHVIGHACTYRVHLKKAGTDRIAIIMDSPYHPYSETRFTLTKKGVEDSDPKNKKGEGHL